MNPPPWSGEPAPRVDQHHAHETLVDPWSGASVAVDRAMVGLVRQLWRHDVRTRYCCQADPGELAYVSVRDAPDAQRLVALLADRFGQQVGVASPADRPRGSISRYRRWQWEVRPWLDGGRWRLGVALFLPLEDVIEVERHLAGRDSNRPGESRDPAGAAL